MSRAECRQLLPSASVGRLAVPTPHFPTIEPVSFAVVEGELVVAVRAGSAGDALAEGTVVTFEADVVDNTGRQGWSVVVGGPIEDLDADVASVVRPQLAPWPVDGTDRLLLVRSERISGQRVVSSGAVAYPAVAVAVPAPARFSRLDLSTDESLALLRKGGQQVGRLVVSLADGPAVFPLNFAVDGDAIVFRTQVGTKLTAITRSLVTFEVDSIDGSGEGWAVIFQGLAQEVIDAHPAELRARVADTVVDTWPGGNRPHMVRITPYRVDGSTWTAIVASPVAASDTLSA